MRRHKKSRPFKLPLTPSTDTLMLKLPTKSWKTTPMKSSDLSIVSPYHASSPNTQNSLLFAFFLMPCRWDLHLILLLQVIFENMLPLYEDQGVIVTRDYILIKKYYFPLATSRTILYSQLEYIALHDASDVTHRWGSCAKYLNNWFPYDSQRKKKTKFIEFVVKGKRMRPSITPDDPEALFAVLNQWLTPKIPQGQSQSENVNNEMESQGKNEFGEPQTIPTVSID